MAKEKKIKDPEKCKHQRVSQDVACACCGAINGWCDNCDSEVFKVNYNSDWEIA